MYYTKQLLNAFFLVTILVLTLLGVDYYLLSWHQGPVMDWMVVPLSWLEELASALTGVTAGTDRGGGGYRLGTASLPQAGIPIPVRTSTGSGDSIDGVTA